MKLRYLALALSMLTLAACSDDADMNAGTDDKGDMIFRANASVSNGWTLISRADPGQTRVEALPKEYHVNVSSLCRYDEESSSHTTSFLKKYPLTFVSTGTESTWRAKGCYWPLNGSMDFIAWAKNGEDAVGSSAVSFNSNTDFDSDFKGMQIDFGQSLDGSDDVLYSNLVAHATRLDGAVPFTFEHATTCVVTSMKAADSITIKNFGLNSITLDEVAVSGKLQLSLREADKDVKFDTLAKQTSYKTEPAWRDTIFTNGYHLSAFDAPTDPADDTKVLPLQLKMDESIEQVRYFVPGHFSTNFIITYTIGKSGKPLSFTYRTNRAWQMALRYNYRFNVKLKKIEVNAEEEQWQTEIGGSAFEPEWDVEVSTGAYEATWGVEIGGEAWEMTWSVEISATALEAGWVSEIGSSAGEDNWNSEIGGNAGENGWNSEIGGGANEGDWNSEIGGSGNEEDWNSETGGSADEENWNSETGGSAEEENWETETGGNASEEEWETETGGGAYEAPWTDGGTEIIGDPQQP